MVHPGNAERQLGNDRLTFFGIFRIFRPPAPARIAYVAGGALAVADNADRR